MERQAVSRCVAIASHGKRCQQSPYRGSPYCWHHLQSRKIPAPSRPGARRPRAGQNEQAAERVLERRSGVDRRLRDARDETQAQRLYRMLGDERAAELLAFLGSSDDGSLLVQKSGEHLRTEVDFIPRLAVRVRRAG